MGERTYDGLTSREILGMLRKAIKEEWPISLEQKEKSAGIVAEIIDNIDGKYQARDIIAATKIQLDMSNSNVKNAIAVDYAHLQREKFEVIANLERNISYSLADGPSRDPIVSDVPMPSIEFIDITPEEEEES